MAISNRREMAVRSATTPSGPTCANTALPSAAPRLTEICAAMTHRLAHICV
jgi:hypothetical protein